MLNIIVAVDKNNLIGNGYKLPWHLPNDLDYFKKTTLGNVIVMGRKTYESIGRELPGRTSIVLTNDVKLIEKNNKLFTNDIESIIKLSFEKEVFIIGGKEIYQLFLEFTDRVFITEIDHEFEGDTYLPKINFEEWVLEKSDVGLTDEKKYL